MYNRYVPNGASFTRIPQEDAPPPPPREEKRPPQQTEGKEKGSLLTGLFKHLKLDELDSGDVLLLLILLFLFLEGDDMELVIVLALVLLLGLR